MPAKSVSDEDLIQQSEQHNGGWHFCGEYVSFRKQDFLAFARALLAGSSHAKAEWISVEERLPEIGTRVIAWQQYSISPFIGYWDGKTWDVDMEHYDIGGAWANGYVVGKIDSEDITHWMPLPAAPLPNEGGEG